MRLKNYLIACAMILMSIPATAQEFYDITEQYLQNSLFDTNFDYKVSETGNVKEELLPIEGWTAAHTAGYTITGIYQIGTKKTFNGASIPAQNVDRTTDGGVLALSTGWEQSLILYQSVTLPAGEYKLVSAYYNGDASKTAGSSLLGWVPASGTSTMSKVNSFTVGQWTTDTLTFKLTATKAGKLQIGFKAAANGSANSAKIAVDYVKLLRDTPFGQTDLVAYKTKLKTLLTTANSQYGTGTKRGAAALKTVIDEAQGIYDSTETTFKQIDEVYDKLDAAINNFKALQTADAALKSILTTAGNTAKTATGQGADELKAAVTTAQAVYDNADATVEQLTEAAETLQAALDLYLYSNPTGAIPTVKTDKRFVRGATMLFGRMSVTTNGATIKQRGICVSESPTPTINDICSSGTVSSGGTIYWVKNLKPATKYYMCAFAVTNGYQVAYGEVVKFYTVPMGTITYSYSNGGDDAINTRIKNALDGACYYFNNMCYTTRHFNVDYSPGTQTADCNYTTQPHMNVGPNTSYQRTGTIMHEMQHGLGLQNYSTQWCKGDLRSEYGRGYWLGDRVTEALHFWDNNTTTRLNGDNIHMWPYGVNGAQEDNGTDALYLANAMICQALGEDGLEHNETRHADPYYSLEQEDNVKYYLSCESVDRGRYTAFLIPSAAGQLSWREMTSAEAAANDSVAWYITFTPSNQYYQLRNAATGQYLTYSSGIKTATKTNLTANENWHLMRGRVDVDGLRGYWVIHPESNWTPHCLQANANGRTGSVTFSIANSADAQRWLIMTIDEAKTSEAKAIAAAKSKAEDALALIRALAAVPHTEDVAGTDQALNQTLESLSALLGTSNSVSELNALVSQAQEAATSFLQNVTATDATQPFDLTYMLVNPALDESTDGWSVAGTVNYGCVEFYEKTFDFNQTVTQLPAGTYRFTAQGFQRPGSYGTAYQDYKNGNNKVNALIYAGTTTAQLCHICDTMLSRKLNKGDETPVTSGKYVPNNMEAANAYFQKGLYPNSVIGTVAQNNGSLKVGIRSTSMPSSYWAIFDDFHLFFYGKMSAETVALGIDEMQTTPTSSFSGSVYTLDGRRLNGNTQLRPGIYVRNGKKIVVK